MDILEALPLMMISQCGKTHSLTIDELCQGDKMETCTQM